MNFAVNQSFKSDIKIEPLDITNLSPVTNLALNLSGLSTSVAGTPNRRISWSNPIPGGDKIGLNLDDLSPSTDSPTFLNTFQNREKLKPKLRRCARKTLLSSNNETNKENITPTVNSGSQVIPFDFEENVFDSRFQDSGYSSISTTTNMSPMCSTSFTRVKSSVFGYEDDDSMESIFRLDCTEDFQDLSSAPDSMSGLLTKPLFLKEKPEHTPGVKKPKLPIRRCLSMEMGSGSAASDNLSKNGTYLSSCSISEERTMDIDLSGKCPFKRPEPPNDYFTSQNKRRKSSPCVETISSSPTEEAFRFKRSFSETAATINHAILKSDSQPELIGDGTRSYVLPLTKGRHQDLKSITAETLVQLLEGRYEGDIDSYALVDCRYPYEFEGGHIQGAENIFTKEDILERFLNNHTDSCKRNVVIFHCEFSSERAPNLCRFLRNKDRELNEGNYPHLHHPEVYILEGGYKSFFEDYKELCEPRSYKPMKHKDHGFELRHFRAKSKSCGADYKSRTKLRSNSNASII